VSAGERLATIEELAGAERSARAKRRRGGGKRGRGEGDEQKVVPEHVTENIDAVASLRSERRGRLTVHQRAIDSATAFVGRPLTVYLLLLVVAGWIAMNLFAAAAGEKPVDPPPFFWLQGAVALYAALVTTVVLTTQARQNKEREHQALLDFQVNLLADQRTAKIIALIEELRRDLPSVRDRVDEVADAMQKAADPKALLVAMEETLEESPARPAGAPPDDDAERGSSAPGSPR